MLSFLIFIYLVIAILLTLTQLVKKLVGKLYEIERCLLASMFFAEHTVLQEQQLN